MATSKKIKLWALGIGWQEFEAEHAKNILNKKGKRFWFEEDQTKPKATPKKATEDK